jgi:peptidyl-prolyl cis-trans isomerase B (cyclophilin B)
MELVPVVEDEFNISCAQDYPADRLEVYSTIGGTPHLDDAYTVFGRVVEGLDVVDKIAAVETAGRDKPVEDVYMTMEVEQISPRKLLKLYGNNLY